MTFAPELTDMISCIYLGKPGVQKHSGEGISLSIVDKLKLYGINSNQIEGGSLDVQYFDLSVFRHFSESPCHYPNSTVLVIDFIKEV